MTGSKTSGTHNWHFIKKCVKCNRVIDQCKCPAEGKTVIYGRCRTCCENISEDGGCLSTNPCPDRGTFGMCTLPEGKKL